MSARQVHGHSEPGSSSFIESRLRQVLIPKNSSGCPSPPPRLYSPQDKAEQCTVALSGLTFLDLKREFSPPELQNPNLRRDFEPLEVKNEHPNGENRPHALRNHDSGSQNEAQEVRKVDSSRENAPPSRRKARTSSAAAPQAPRGSGSMGPRRRAGGQNSRVRPEKAASRGGSQGVRPCAEDLPRGARRG